LLFRSVMALTCAAVDDVTAWCLLAFLVSIVHARAGGALLTLVLTILFILVMIIAVRPLVIRAVHHQEVHGLTRGAMTAVCVGLLVSALISEFIGIHAIFGAFLLGTLIPHDSAVARQLQNKLEDLVIVLFLPAYFAFTGMRTQIGLLSGAEHWILCGMIILVASLGKFGGSFLAARLTGTPVKDSVALGVLMNTRGLMELIVLNIGMDLRIISPVLFAMLVIMALVTTLATSPVLHHLVGIQISHRRNTEVPHVSSM
jgi:Kef-type K+ transport system membrane component KefB